MTSGDRPVGDPVAWDGQSSSLAEIEQVLAPVTPTGTLRLVLQRLALHEAGEPAGEHAVLDAVTDVGGNLVVVPLQGRVREDAALAQDLEEAVRTLREDLAASGTVGVDALEVVLDADGARQVLVGFGLELTGEEATGSPRHPAVHDGAHHITYDAPALDDLRDRLRPPEPGPLGRLWRRLRGRD